MQRYAVGIEFCGIRYRGWQTQQAGVPSVQETLERVLSKIADEKLFCMVPGVLMLVYMPLIWLHTLIPMPFARNAAG